MKRLFGLMTGLVMLLAADVGYAQPHGENGERGKRTQGERQVRGRGR